MDSKKRYLVPTEKLFEIDEDKIEDLLRKLDHAKVFSIVEVVGFASVEERKHITIDLGDK
jgi:hypothetical protein